ncbi:MAG: hypothetical protein HS116_09340 [Planctomycetes bacterium]|nr:hypothetical protein [Planctomycetota bacterium]
MSASLSVALPRARQRLLNEIDRVLWRLRVQEALRSGVFSLTVVAFLGIPLIFVDKLLYLSAIGISVYIVWAALAALCIPYVLLRCFSNRIHEALAATLADERLGLHARLCTALTLRADEATGFGEAFFAEASERLAALDATQAVPLNAPRFLAVLPLPLLIAGGLWKFMPQKDLLGLVEQRAEAERRDRAKRETVEDLKKQLGKLEDLQAKDQTQVKENSAEYKSKQLIQQAKDIAKQIEEGEKSAEEGIVALAELKRAIEEQKEEIKEGKDFGDRLKKLAEKDLSMEDGALTKEVSEALQQGDAALAAQQMRRLGRKLKQDILENEKLSAEQKAEAMKQLQREMEKLAGALAEEEALREGLQEVTQQSMKASDYDALQKEIEKHQQQQQEKKNQDQQDGNQDGGMQSELAEQLQESLDQLAGDMEKAGDANDEQLADDEQQAMEEMESLEEGVDEAMESLVGACEGGNCQGGGEKSGASSGKSASKSGQGKQGREGGKRAGKGGGQEGQDGQQGNQAGQNGGQESNQGGNNQGNGNGEKGQGGQQPSFSGPNQGGQGSGRRAYREGDAWFEESKVKGKLQAGAITGLSHFRGQGAKGEVPEAYVQALTTAEQEMASSLEMDRVPADAQEMVKDYFLNLKQDAGIVRPVAPPAPAPAATGGEELKE